MAASVGDTHTGDWRAVTLTRVGLARGGAMSAPRAITLKPGLKCGSNSVRRDGPTCQQCPVPSTRAGRRAMKTDNASLFRGERLPQLTSGYFGPWRVSSVKVGGALVDKLQVGESNPPGRLRDMSKELDDAVRNDRC